MRISDWSSDVCSSDLRPAHRGYCRPAAGLLDRETTPSAWRRCGVRQVKQSLGPIQTSRELSLPGPWSRYMAPTCFGRPQRITHYQRPLRSAEHTSEIQSLMRISYAVFCFHNTKQNHARHVQIFKKNKS